MRTVQSSKGPIFVIENEHENPGYEYLLGRTKKDEENHQ